MNWKQLATNTCHQYHTNIPASGKYLKKSSDLLQTKHETGFRTGWTWSVSPSLCQSVWKLSFPWTFYGVTHERGAFARQCHQPFVWQDLIQSRLHLPIFQADEKDVRRRWPGGSSPSVLLILPLRLESLAQPNGTKRGHLTTLEIKFILFYYLCQVTMCSSAKSLATNFIFYCFLNIMVTLGIAVSLWNRTLWSLVSASLRNPKKSWMLLSLHVHLQAWGTSWVSWAQHERENVTLITYMIIRSCTIYMGTQFSLMGVKPLHRGENPCNTWPQNYFTCCLYLICTLHAVWFPYKLHMRFFYST